MPKIIQTRNVQIKIGRSKVTTVNLLLKNEEQELYAACGDAAVRLFNFYLAKLSPRNDYIISDKKTAEYFTWSVFKAKKVRLKLVQAKYLLEKTNTLPDGTQHHRYFLGKEAVYEYLTTGLPSSTIKIVIANAGQRVMDELDIETEEELQQDPIATRLLEQYFHEGITEADIRTAA